MKRNIVLGAIIALALLAPTSTWATPIVVYSTVPSVPPPNVPSLGYEATSASRAGDLIDVGGPILAQQIVVGISEWAFESQYQTVGTSAGFFHDFTIEAYGVGAGNSVGPLLYSQTANFMIPWRPEPSANCNPGSNSNYQGSDGNCYAGALSFITFNTPDIPLPQQFILALAYNTQHYGDNPDGVAGPINSTNLALDSSGPTVGTKVLSDTLYWQTSFDGFMTDGGAGGHNQFRQDTGWTPYNAMMEVRAAEPVPEPASLLLLGTGLAIVARRYRRKAQ